MSAFLLSYKVAHRFLLATNKPNKKRMIVMMGPPAAGKGFFIGEPPPSFGWKLPQMLVDDQGNPLLTEDDIPERPTADESDNHLRAIQYEEAKEHFQALGAARDQGEDAFKKALSDHWYATKDGGKVELGNVISFEDFPQDFKQYFDKTNKDFYVSMRGWHDDAEQENETTGKPKERFKDEARHRFDESVSKKIEQVEDLLIVDSAGEDIDAQDYRGQIEQAKAHGYEVTVIFLHPEQADTELSNLARGKVMGKRMVDQVDISNWYERNAEALQDIQAAAPDNFVHYRKGPPDSDPAKAAALRERAREQMNKLSGLSGEEKEATKKEINKVLYGMAGYKLNKETSYGVALSGLPNKPRVDSIADVVSKMNEEAQARAKPAPEKEPGVTKAPPQEDRPTALKKPVKDEKKSKTRMNFLREMGDKKIPNPNPETRDRFKQIKIRSLPWMYQKPIYEQWAQRAAAIRVAARFRSRMASGWLSNWMSELADELSKLKVEGYEVKAESGKGPEVFVTLVGASEDDTTARKVGQQVKKLMEASIKKNTDGVQGFDARVQSFNRGHDLLLQCTIVFP